MAPRTHRTNVRAGGSEVCLDGAQLEALAALIADRLAERPRTPLVGVREAAAYLGCEASWVYEHADEIGVRRLGSGPKARLRFNLDEVDAHLSPCLASKGSSARSSVPAKAPRRHALRAMGTNTELLPVHGQSRPQMTARDAA